jgi:hypothetical protein
MIGRYLLKSKKQGVHANIFAARSSVVLEWVLVEGINRNIFSLRDVVKERNISIGTVQKVFEVLVLYGILKTEGVRTAKRFFLHNPKLLLKNWTEAYSIVKKCKMWNYRSGFGSKKEMLKELEKSGLLKKVALALHSAAEVHGYKNTNLETLELYMLEPDLRLKLEKVLRLEEQERGYEILLIEPFYKSLLKDEGVSPPLLTYLDLYHFPLRGLEQAEFLEQRHRDLKNIYHKR